MALTHLRAWRKLSSAVALEAIVDPETERARAATLQDKGLRVLATHTPLLDDERVQVVDLVVPHHAHLLLAREFLAAGKDVIIEKPLTLTLAGCEELQALAASRNRLLVVKRYLRHDRLQQVSASLLGSGAIGRPYSVSALFASDNVTAMRSADDWRGDWGRCGGGVTIDATHHVFDALHALFGEVETIQGVIRQASDGIPSDKAEDSSSFVATYADGVVASVVSTWADTSRPFRLEWTILGTRGAIHFLGQRRLGRLVLDTEGRRQIVATERDWWWRANFRALAACISAIRAREVPRALSADEARQTLATVLAGYRSSITGVPTAPSEIEGDWRVMTHGGW